MAIEVRRGVGGRRCFEGDGPTVGNAEEKRALAELDLPVTQLRFASRFLRFAWCVQWTPVWPERVTYVLGTLCHPCLRAEPFEKARPERFELPTLWFEARCSDPLSYGRVKDIIALARGNSITAADGRRAEVRQP